MTDLDLALLAAVARLQCWGTPPGARLKLERRARLVSGTRRGGAAVCPADVPGESVPIRCLRVGTLESLRLARGRVQLVQAVVDGVPQWAILPRAAHQQAEVHPEPCADLMCSEPDAQDNGRHEPKSRALARVVQGEREARVCGLADRDAPGVEGPRPAVIPLVGGIVDAQGGGRLELLVVRVRGAGVGAGHVRRAGDVAEVVVAVLGSVRGVEERVEVEERAFGVRSERRAAAQVPVPGAAAS